MLLVDDSDEIRELWRLWLTFWGFTVDEARNGHEALQKAQISAPVLILMDLWMPGIDGVEATKRLKADVRTAHVPVLAISAQSRSPTAATAIAAGAEAFVSKSCDPELLLQQIRLALNPLPRP